jgi:hypothetical protein
VGFGFGGWYSAEAVHQALLVVPGDVVGGDVLDIAQGPQRAAAKRGVCPDALVFVEADRGPRQRVVIGIADAADRGPQSRKAQCFTESHAGVLTRFNRWTQHLDDGGVFDGIAGNQGQPNRFAEDIAGGSRLRRFQQVALRQCGCNKTEPVKLFV